MPGNPDADSNGYVQSPNVDLAVENVNANQSSKSYRLVTRILMHFDPSFLAPDGGDRSDAFVISDRDARYNDAVQLELATIIHSFPGVSDAKVIIKAERNQPIDDSNPPTAAVLMTTEFTLKQPRSLVAPAACLVAGAVSGLTLENISVIINGVSYRASDSSSP